MSERDLKRIDVLSGRWTVAAGATVLAISKRQAYPLLARYGTGGGAELVHKHAARCRAGAWTPASGNMPSSW